MNDFFFGVTDQTDHDILMHRDVHFGGNFLVMIDYYKNGGKGVCQEFEIERLEELCQIEKQSHQNLADCLLMEEENEKVKRAKEKYFSLRSLYEMSASDLAQKVANLILTEDPEAEEEIRDLCNVGEASIPLLIEILSQDEFFDPLFPGYGIAPAHAAKCLGLLKAQKAIVPLFEALPNSEFFIEEQILSALVQIGVPARDFLLSVLKRRPITRDNENAAIALLGFQEDSIVSHATLEILKDQKIFEYGTFMSYLLLLCDGIADSDGKEQLLLLYKNPSLPSVINEELEWMLKKWKLLPS